MPLRRRLAALLRNQACERYLISDFSIDCCANSYLAFRTLGVLLFLCIPVRTCPV